MYQNEIDKLSKKIDEQNIRMEAKKALHNIVEEFFSIDYHNISEERKRDIKDKFEIRRLDCIVVCTTFDVNEVEEILNQIENNLFTILDQSVDKAKSDKKLMDISKSDIKKEFMIPIIVKVLSGLIVGIILIYASQHINSITSVNTSMEKNESESYNNQITQTVILDSIWVYKDKPVLAFNNQILIEVSFSSSFIQCGTFDLKIQDKDSIHFGLACIGKRQKFSYNNHEYLFDVLEINDSGAKVTITKII